jgi:Carbohydrate esterase, sialic acid-specific acetylesterase
MAYQKFLHTARVSICGTLLMAVMLPASTSAQTKSQDPALELQTVEDFHAAELMLARKPVNEADDDYRAKLEKHQKTAQAAGDLKGVLAAKQAIADLDVGRQSLVSDDPGVAGIQKAYIARRQKADAASKLAISKIDQAHLASLKRLVVELTKAGHIDQAQKVQGKVDGLAEILNPKADPQQSATGGQELEIWKKKAQEEFPALKDPASPLNKRLKALMAEKKGIPGYFKNPQWPYLLAKEADLESKGIVLAPVDMPQTKQPDPQSKGADMSQPVQVFIMMGEANMVGLGKTGPESANGSLKFYCKTEKKYLHLIDNTDKWNARKDVRCAMVTCDHQTGWLEPGFGLKGGIGPELGFGHVVGHALDAPVLLIKACSGNRSLGWDLLPPGSERFEEGGKMYAGYKDPQPFWDKGDKPAAGGWYAGKQYDDDTANAKAALADLDSNYPGAKKYEVSGFVFWQGEKDLGNAVHATHYEKNLVAFIKRLRKDFDAPNAKFVLATLGESAKGGGGNGGKILDAHLAVDGKDGKYKEFKGNVTTVYSNPLSNGGSGNSHYGGNAGTYMNVGEAMGRAMVELLGAK